MDGAAAVDALVCVVDAVTGARHALSHDLHVLVE